MTPFASFLHELEMETALLSDLFKSLEELVSVHRAIIGQICPKFE